MQRKALMIGLSGVTLLAAGAAYALVQKPNVGPAKPALGIVASDDDGDQVVTLDQVPTAVRATILAHADAGTITQIESETEDGARIYSVEYSDGEFGVAADGTFLGMEDDDGPDGDDEQDED